MKFLGFCKHEKYSLFHIILCCVLNFRKCKFSVIKKFHFYLVSKKKGFGSAGNRPLSMVFISAFLERVSTSN